MPIKKLQLATILTDQGTDVRYEINDTIVTEYGQATHDEKVKFPPLEVFELPDGTKVLADGFHRYFGFERQGIKEYDCNVRKGTMEEALIFALGCNESHGYRRTNNDKRNAVEIAITKFPKLSDGKLAEMCKVSRQYVSQGGFREWHTAQLEAAKEAAGPAEAAVVIPPRKNGKPASTPPPRPNGKPVSRNNPATPPADDDSQSQPPVSNTMDATGIEVPEEIVPYWDMSLTESQRLLQFVSEVRIRVKRAQDTNEPMFREVDHTDVIAKLDLVYANLKLVKPYAVCPECQGKGKITKDCQCKGRGFVSQFYWDKAVPAETKTLTGRE
jgi:hypothetical protein